MHAPLRIPLRTPSEAPLSEDSLSDLETMHDSALEAAAESVDGFVLLDRETLVIEDGPHTVKFKVSLHYTAEVPAGTFDSLVPAAGQLLSLMAARVK